MKIMSVVGNDQRGNSCSKSIKVGKDQAVLTELGICALQQCGEELLTCSQDGEGVVTKLGGRYAC